jgi:acetylornithine deacetylase/succinyl-diaminopimelate desuccinylase-like protein
VTPDEERARDIFRELIEIDTTDETGDVTVAAGAVAARFLDAGFDADDVVVAGAHPKKHNLVARLRGNGAHAPLLLLAHLDVVAAPREQWSVEPFKFLERDGHYYGRGTTDDKAMAALWVATLLRIKASGLHLSRDLILALTADEEGGSHNGVKWLLAHRPELVRAEFGLNEGGYGRIRDGQRIANQIQASEKTPVFFELVATGQAGHSSLPPSDSAIVRLAAAVAKVTALRFPAELSEVTRSFFERMGEDVSDLEKLSANPYYAGLLRNTAVVTRLSAGVGDNVVPQEARALVDCRLLPGADPLQVRETLIRTIDDPKVEVRIRPGAPPAPASPLRDDLVHAVERISEELWPGVPVMPVMSIGATDSAHFRRAGTPMYGVSGLFLDVNDTRAHGPDERVLVQSFHEAQEFLYRLVTALAT